MERYNKSDIEFIDVVSSGTAAAFIGRNKITGKKGVYKDNGCMMGISNEDVREKLASQIITEIGGYCANIDLIFDEELNQNACFSNYIIGEDENLIYVEGNYYTKHNVEDYISSYIKSVEEINNAPGFLKIVKKDLCRYIYASCLLDSYDIQTEIVENKKTGETKISPWFDFGVAFIEDGYHRKGFFKYSNSDEVLKKLFDNHFEEIAEISEKVNEVLTDEKIKELFYQDYVEEAFEKSELDKIKNRFMSQVEKSNDIREEKIAKIEKGQNGEIDEIDLKNKILNLFNKIKERLVEFKNKINSNKALPPVEDKNQDELAVYENILDKQNELKNEFKKENSKLTSDISTNLETTISNLNEESRIEELIHKKYEEENESKEKKEIE